MRRINLFENLRKFISSKPPAIVFILCLFSFIIILCSFMAYIKSHLVQNPDVIDWNIFRARMAALEFCVRYPQKNSDGQSNILKTTEKPNKNEIKEKKKNSYIYDMTFVLDYYGNSTELKSLSFLHGKIDGFLLGFEKESLDVTIKVNKIMPIYDDACNKNMLRNLDCDQFYINGCITLTASAAIFPKTTAPKKCSSGSMQNLNYFKSWNTTIEGFKETPSLTRQFWCPTSYGAKSKIKNKRDPSLTAFLNQADKNLICNNLTFITIALAFVITFYIVYGTIESAKRKSNLYSEVNEI